MFSVGVPPGPGLGTTALGPGLGITVWELLGVSKPVPGGPLSCRD